MSEPDDPSSADFEREFGVSPICSGEISGLSGWWLAPIDAHSRVMIRGESRQDLWDELVRHRWLKHELAVHRLVEEDAAERRRRPRQLPDIADASLHGQAWRPQIINNSD